MKAELRTTLALLSWPPVLLLALSCGLTVLVQMGPKIYGAALPFALIFCISMLALRIARVLEAGVWRLLPGGYQAAVRATALVVLLMSLTLGATYMWAAPKTMRFVPAWPLVALFIHFSVLGLMLLMGIGQRLPRVFPILCVAICTISFGILTRFRGIAWPWFTAVAVFATIWLYASFGTPHWLRSENARRWLNFEALLAGVRARTNFHFATLSSPARALLRTRQSASFLSLPVAALAMIVWLANYHLVIGVGRVLGNYRALFGGASWMLSCVMLVLAQRYAAPSRSLWLRWGDSRAQIFRLAERQMLLDAFFLGAFTWYVAILFGMQAGLPVEPIMTMKLFVACVAVGLIPGYLGMIWSTCHTWWQKALALAPIALTLTRLSNQWVFALGIRANWNFPVLWDLFVLFSLGVVAFRFIAAWRWKRLDWAHFRSIRRKK